MLSVYSMSYVFSLKETQKMNWGCQVTSRLVKVVHPTKSSPANNPLMKISLCLTFEYFHRLFKIFVTVRLYLWMDLQELTRHEFISV